MGVAGATGSTGPAGAVGPTGPNSAWDNISSTFGGDLTFNQIITKVAGATSGSYTGHIVATASNGHQYYGRAATTVICQQNFGAGARMCSVQDLQLLMEGNAIVPVSPDVTTYTPSTAYSLPTVNTWINTGSFRSDGTNMYNDCFNWSGSSVTSYTGTYYNAPNSSWPFGYGEQAGCGNSYPLMCCQ